MARVEELNERLARIGIDDEENAELIFDEEVEDVSNKFNCCLVGCFLTEKGVNVRAMKSKIADIWRPARGISIKDLKPGVFLFQFYHVDDMDWVFNGGPWSFDGVMLVLNKIGGGEDPLEVPLFNLQFWIRLFGVPSGLMTEIAGKQLGNFFGTFISYDSNNNSSIWRECMRIKISIDVRQPLKRKKKICRKNGAECIVQCKYERLGDFCFVCGLVTHTERFCSQKFSVISKDVVREWGPWLRAPARRSVGQDRSKFLRDERDIDWDAFHENSNPCQQVSGDSGKQVVKTGFQERNVSITLSNEAKNPGFNSNNMSEALVAAKFKNHCGPTEEELVGFNMEERNKRRRGPEGNNFMEIEGISRDLHTEASLSTADYLVSSTYDLATLARQASHQQ